MENNYHILKEKAYKSALRFKKTELKEDIIYAKLEKQGFPIEVIKEVTANILIKRSNSLKKDIFDYKKFGLIVVLAWSLLSMITFVITGNISNAILILISGVGASFLIHSMTTSE